MIVVGHGVKFGTGTEQTVVWKINRKLPIEPLLGQPQ